ITVGAVYDCAHFILSAARRNDVPSRRGIAASRLSAAGTWRGLRGAGLRSDTLHSSCIHFRHKQFAELAIRKPDRVYQTVRALPFPDEMRSPAMERNRPRASSIGLSIRTTPRCRLRTNFGHRDPTTSM